MDTSNAGVRTCSAEYCIPVAFDQQCRARKLNNLQWSAFVSPTSSSASQLPYDPVIEDILFVCFDRALTNGAEALDADDRTVNGSTSLPLVERLRCQGHNVEAVVELLTHRDSSRSTTTVGQASLLPKAVAAAMLQYLVRLCKYAPSSFLLRYVQRILEKIMPAAFEHAIAPEEVLLAAFKNVARRVPSEYWALAPSSESTAVHRWRWLAQRLTQLHPTRRVALVLVDRVLREPSLPIPPYAAALLSELSAACAAVIAALAKSDVDYAAVVSLRRRCNEVVAASSLPSSSQGFQELPASTAASSAPPQPLLQTQDPVIDRETLLAFVDEKNAQLECELAVLKSQLAEALAAQKALEEIAQHHAARTESLDAELMSSVDDSSTRARLRRAISNLVNRVLASS